MKQEHKKDENGWASQDDYLHYDSKYALVDGDFTTEWKVDNWDTGASYGADRGSEITFDDTYTIGSIGIGRTLQSGHYMGLYKVKVTYWDENDNKNVVYTESINEIASIALLLASSNNRKASINFFKTFSKNFLEYSPYIPIDGSSIIKSGHFLKASLTLIAE